MSSVYDVQFVIAFFCGFVVSLCLVSIFLLLDFIFDKFREKIQNHNSRFTRIFFKFNDVLSEIYFCRNHLKKLENKLDQIIDFINDNECSVKDDE